MTDADEPSPADKPGRAPRAWYPAVLTVAVVAQVLVLGLTGTWGLAAPNGLIWILALAQTVIGFGVIYTLAAGRRRIVLLVPVASLVLTIVIFLLGTLLAEARACSAQERSLAGELASPPGVTIDLRGRVDNLCWAQFTSDLSTEALIEHYRTEFDAHGWQIIRPGHYGGSGEGIAAVKNRIVVEVNIGQPFGPDHHGVISSEREPHALFVSGQPQRVDYSECSETEISAITALTHPRGGPPESHGPQGETDVGCVTRFSVETTTPPAAAILAATLEHYRVQLEERGWQILQLRTGDDAASLTATDGSTLVTVVAEVYREGIPRSQEPRDFLVTLTAEGEQPAAP